ncbi:MAG: transcriptional repressor [Chloroflexi bacterium]|nr:transcriptional repressor [Ktedonobacteraceae bacterium]MBV9708970.1 transcriptional repressor [Chloroflexota bacterium]
MTGTTRGHHETPSATEIIAELERIGFRSTQRRYLIAEQVAQLGARGIDFTGEELWHMLRANYPGTGRMTVFRMLDVLIKLGIVDRLTFIDGTERYHVGYGTHHYVKCESCHKVVELDLTLQSDLLNEAAHQSGFMPLGQRIEIDGWCSDCQKEQSTRVLRRRFFLPRS